MPLFQGYISYAPFPEGFQGDMDETFQQSGQLATLYVSGNFLSGLYYPIGTTPPPTLPTSDQGPIVLNGQWYFWDPVSGQYLPQSNSVKTARNYTKNAIYQIQQLGNSFSLTTTGSTATYDMVKSRATEASILSISLDVGPAASADTDNIGSAIKYTVGTTLVPTLAATDFFAHEHLIEGADIAGIQGEVMSLAFSVWVNQPGNYSAYITTGAQDASYVLPFTVTTANTYTRIKFSNIPAFPTGFGTWNFGEGQTALRIGVVMAVGAQYQTPTPNKWVAGFFVGTAANSNMVSVTNNQMKITGIKFESSPSPTFLTANSFEQDFHDAIRYYQTGFTYQSLTAGVPIMTTAWSANAAMFSFLFPRRMCKVPSVVPYSWNPITAGQVSNISTGVNYAAATLGANNKGIIASPTGLTAAKADVFACYFIADARLT